MPSTTQLTLYVVIISFAYGNFGGYAGVKVILQMSLM